MKNITNLLIAFFLVIVVGVLSIIPPFDSSGQDPQTVDLCKKCQLHYTDSISCKVSSIDSVLCIIKKRHNTINKLQKETTVLFEQAKLVVYNKPFIDTTVEIRDTTFVNKKFFGLFKNKTTTHLIDTIIIQQ